MRPDSLVGEVVAHYRITDFLGGGGMGLVYKAEDTKLRRAVALKFLSIELTQNQQAKDRFIQEARAASALDHPNICTIHSIEETDDGQMFICMAYCDGHTLKPPKPTELPEIATVVDLAIQVGKGLAKAHQNGIIHRDIKPANLIVTKDGLVKIVDFGLAKLGGATRITKTGTTMGTPAYMSPEQVRGVDVDHRTDIWSLGVIMYEQLSAELPFKGEYEMSLLYSIVNEQPVPISNLRPDLPSELADLVMKTLEKDREKRFADMAELVETLTAFQAGQATRPAMQAELDSAQPTRTMVAHETRPARVPREADITVAIDAGKADSKPGRTAARWFPLLLLVAVVTALGVLFLPKLRTVFTTPAGYVQVDSEPAGAEIVFDGEPTGLTTPALLSNVAPGSHRLALQLVEYQGWSQEFSVTDGDTATLRARLLPLLAHVSPGSQPGPEVEPSAPAADKPATETVPKSPGGPEVLPRSTEGRLYVSSEPSGAVIFLNDENTNQRTPFDFGNLNPGVYEVRLTYPGYLPATRTIEVQAGQTARLRFSLKTEPPGTLIVPAIMIANQMVFPEIFVNGESHGQPPLMLELPSGTYEVTAKLLGYITENPNQKIQIKSGKDVTVTFRFRKAGAP